MQLGSCQKGLELVAVESKDDVMAFSLHKNNFRCFKAQKHVLDSDATKINRLINKTNLSNVEKHSDSCWLTSAAFVASKTILDRDSALMFDDLGIGSGHGTALMIGQQ